MRIKRSLLVLLASALTLACIGVVAALWAVDRAGVMPRTLAPYIERRSDGHNPVIEAVGRWSGHFLRIQDRAMPALLALPALPQAPSLRTADTTGSTVLVSSSAELVTAIEHAEAGDLITILPGKYRFIDKLKVERPGRAGMPVTVRAIEAGSVVLEFVNLEGFKVSAPYWRFENLSIHGTCSDDSYCEHAFHVVGGAHHFSALNNTILDFNAHFKINGENHVFPDNGLIEGNVLSNTRVRQTSNPVTPIDLVGASDWTVRRNIITDFIKGQGNGISYGAFFKGAGSGNVFEKNTVLCEHRLRGHPGQSVGLSLGGGGTGADFCRDRRCVTEQNQGTIRANLIGSCSDVGIYLNSAADSRLSHNTLIDTGGIDVRFATSSATLEGNLIDGPIRSRNGGVVRDNDNRITPPWYAYLGYHPVRALFRAPADFDYSWQGGAAAVPRRDAGVGAPVDMCGATRPTQPAYGATEDYACVAVGTALR